MKGVLAALWCSPDAVMHLELWRLLTAGILTDPRSISPLLFTLVGLYFLSPDLERRWGSARFIRFLAWSTIAGNALAVLVDRIAPASIEPLHPSTLFGATAAITAIAVAWSRANATAQVRLFFVLPMSGRALFWVTVGFCARGPLPRTRRELEGSSRRSAGSSPGCSSAASRRRSARAYLRAKLALLRAARRGACRRRSTSRPAEARPILRRRAGTARRFASFRGGSRTS